MFNTELIKILNDHDQLDTVNLVDFCPKWDKIPIDRIRKGIELYKKGSKDGYFKVETLRWNTKPSKYTTHDLYLTSNFENLPDKFHKVVTKYKPVKKESRGFFSYFFSHKKTVEPVKDEKSAKYRKALTHNIKMAVWCEEELRTKDLKWKGKSWITHNTRLCFACLNVVTSDNCHVAHIVPHANGGKDEVSNLRISCAGCNSGKGGMSTFHAYEWLIFTNKPGLKFMDINDPNYTTAVLLNNYHNICSKLVKKPSCLPNTLPSLKSPIKDRIACYMYIMKQMSS